MHALTEEKNYDAKESFYEELEQVFDNFPKYHMKILLGDFNANMGRKDIFKLTVGNEGSHQNINDNDVSWRSWLWHCASNRKVVVSIPDGVTGIFQ